MADDPLFNEAIEEIEAIANAPAPEDPTKPRAFFRKQMAYLLLWSSIERYVSLRWGFGSDDVTKRVERLAAEPAFCEALAKFVKEGRRVRRTDDPKKSRVLDKSEPLKSVRYYYQVRSIWSIGARRQYETVKSWRLLFASLLNIYRYVLDETLDRSVANQSDHFTASPGAPPWQ